MLGSGTESTAITWSVPECPFTVECSARALDDIRLMITDAFFSLAKGGLEVGGVLLGRFDGQRLSVMDYVPLECEHAYGPSFTASLNDEAHLRDLLASLPASHPGLQVVGWYHSHTRSGIHLSDEDLDLYNSFFPEPWHVALVIKPHTFDPPRIGFFFREADGTVYAKESYKELTLEPLPMRQIPMNAPAPVKSRPVADDVHDRPRRKLNQVEVEVTAEAVTEPVAVAPPVATPVAPRVAEPVPVPLVQAAAPLHRAPEPKPEPKPEPVVPTPVVEHRLPSFATEEEEKPSGRGRVVVWIILGAAATLGVIFGAVETREMWMPRFVAAMHPPAPQAPLPLPPPSIGLRASDHDGQLEIVWDRYSTGIRQGASGRLEISDGGPTPQAIPLDSAHLQMGVFTYGRQSEKVDVKLIVRNTDGRDSSEVATYVGKLPERKPPPEDVEAKKQRDELAAQAAKMKADLTWQALKTKKLEKQLQSLQDQQKRMQNQVEGK
jgi:proteasome lid subunit RPN8/RPN11